MNSIKWQNPNYYIPSLWSFDIESYLTALLLFECFIDVWDFTCIVLFNPLKNLVDCRYYFLLML